MVNSFDRICVQKSSLDLLHARTCTTSGEKTQDMVAVIPCQTWNWLSLPSPNYIIDALVFAIFDILSPLTKIVHKMKGLEGTGELRRNSRRQWHVYPTATCLCLVHQVPVCRSSSFVAEAVPFRSSINLSLDQSSRSITFRKSPLLSPDKGSPPVLRIILSIVSPPWSCTNLVHPSTPKTWKVWKANLFLLPLVCFFFVTFPNAFPHHIHLVADSIYKAHGRNCESNTYFSVLPCLPPSTWWVGLTTYHADPRTSQTQWNCVAMPSPQLHSFESCKSSLTSTKRV
jgi:hypothetical protein